VSWRRCSARINDEQRSDWISEGFAEFYAIELVRRAGGMSDERYQSLQAKLARDSQKVTTLRGEHGSARRRCRKQW
jgi:predicted metalloprotease with PDZ domain